MSRGKIKPRIGDVFEIPLGDGKLGFGHVLSTIYLGFYAVQSDRRLPVEEIVTKDVAFRVVCMMDALAEGRWPIFANAPRPPAMNVTIRTWARPVGGELLLCEWTPETGTLERPASPEEVKGLENDGIWDSRSIPVRLQKFFRGEPSAIVKLG